MIEAKFKLMDGTFLTVEDVDLSHAPEIVGIPNEEEWSLYTESLNGSETTDFIGERTTREERN